MQARAVDPRSVTWQVDEPAFWVTFFRRDPQAADVPSRWVGYEAEEWELTGGDVSEALAWAAERAGPERTWTLHVAGPPSGPLGLIRLAGADPNAAHAPTARWHFDVPPDGSDRPAAE